MKSKILLVLVFLSVIACSGFTDVNEINSCFISFIHPTGLTPSEPDKLPETSEKFRKLKTNSGEVVITRLDGYRILYNNNKDVAFVNLKVELSDIKSYKTDQNALIENLKYLNAHSIGMETKDLIEIEFNGYKVYGLSRGAIESGSTLSTFVLFPGNGVIVYFYFNNIKPENRNFENLADYKKIRDKFIDEYTKYLAACLKK